MPTQGVPVLQNGDPVRKTFVLAGSHTQFLNWCRYSRVNPRSRNVHYLDGAQKLHGFNDFDVVYTGTENPRHLAVLRELVYRGALGYIKHTYGQHESCEIEPNVVDTPVP